MSAPSIANNARPDGGPVLRLAQRLAREQRPDEAEAILRRSSIGGATAPAIARELARLLQAQRHYGDAERQ